MLILRNAVALLALAVVALFVVAAVTGHGDQRNLGQRDPRLAVLDQHADRVLNMYHGGESVSLNPSPILCDGLDKSWLPTSPGTYGDIVFQHVPGEATGAGGTWKDYVIEAGTKSVGFDHIWIRITYDPVIDNCVGDLGYSMNLP